MESIKLQSIQVNKLSFKGNSSLPEQVTSQIHSTWGHVWFLTSLKTTRKTTTKQCKSDKSRYELYCIKLPFTHFPIFTTIRVNISAQMYLLDLATHAMLSGNLPNQSALYHHLTEYLV